MPPKTNFGPCAIENCQYSTLKFCKFTELAAEKAQNSRTLSILEYSHLIPNQHQLCDRHYLLIICIPKQDFLNLVSNIEYLQKNQKDEIFEEITENFETINENIENINENNTFNVIYNQQQKFGNNPEYDPIKFKQMIEQNEPKLIGFFDELVEGLIPKTRSSYNQEEAKKSIVSFCYLFAGLRNKFANNYKLDIGLHLALARTSYKGIDILSNTGLTVSSKTVLRFKQQIAEDHFKKISKYFNENINCLYTFNLDDYHSIHEIHRPNNTFYLQLNILQHAQLKNIDNLTIHLYEDAILELKEERSMKDLQLVDFKELELHSFDNYADALKMIINIPSLNNYLKQNVIPIITDWPGQLFIRKIITYLKIQQLASNIPQVYKNFYPIIGPLHVALNSKETALIINYKFFKQLFHFVFKKFGPYCKDTEYRMAIDLLDNIIPATLDIYAVLFRSGSYMEYIETIFRIWTFALKWSRKHYNKAPLAFLSDIFYWTDNNHPFNESIQSFLVHFNDYYVENMHSRIRAYTTKYSTTDEIIREAFVIDSHCHDQFKQTFQNFKKYSYTQSSLEYLIQKTSIFLLNYFKKIYLSKGLGYQDTNFKSFYYHLGYHIICYNAMEERCKFCYDYYGTGIKNNVKSFINRLEKGANILTEDDIDIDNDEDNENENNNNNNNNDDDEVENLNLVLSEKDKIEQEFTDKLVNVLNW
ncbi:hypothetical protein C2G38_2253762 [Gigaspora rosea]|uniref:Uncharacterized protein n=1 Tax=Gigaspora rosea TaxID=44941 RepID=A0A397U5P0_9GLOM|nr:hypothetical protein C2G38_2253762 [Gigaspora rosea]